MNTIEKAVRKLIILYSEQGLAAFLFLQCDSAYKLVCYFTNWAQARRGALCPPHLCTHLIYAFANISENEITTSMERPNRWTFIRSVIEFLKMNKFDGFSLYWIYPEGKNKGHFTSLIQVQAVDFLTFDFHGSWQKVTGHVSPFLQGKEDSKSSSYYNVDYAVRYWRSKGAPAEKLIMGIPTYGRSFALSSSKTGISAPISGPGSPGPFTQEAGLLAYYEICTFTPGATTERIVEQEVPYSYKGNQWVGYDDEQSITTKVQYLKNNKLGGAMIWAVDLDDFDGLFCSQKKPYPLIGTVTAKLSSGN
ncbi:chitinase-3-like protein 1 [Emys orbicularis]|uniref:chitinase-3-like protein 1 n=1 Tax=Emys orbicularis TaxID=82168 RepID=UPI0031FC9EBF